MSSSWSGLAAGCIFPSFPGFEAPEWVLRRIEGGLGGICLFGYNVRDRAQLAALTASLRAVRGDLLIGIDEEGGDVTRLEGDRGSSYPGAGALGAVDDVALTERVSAAIGADLRAVGVNLDFAPVADVNVNPANPVIGIRSFGSDPELVARHVAASVLGLQRQGVAACAKHFPGHGSTEQDSHLELPVVVGDAREGLPPFRAAIEAGVKTIMTAHVRVPALDDAPATVSPAVVQGLLRDVLGFDGVVIADALEMKGLSDSVGIERGAVLALEAGVDALLIGHDLGEDAVEAVQRALVESVSEARLREAAGRVARVGAWAASAPVGGPVDRGAGEKAARLALQIDGDVSLEGAPFVVELRPQANIAAGEAAAFARRGDRGAAPGNRGGRLRRGERPSGDGGADGRREAGRDRRSRRASAPLDAGVRGQAAGVGRRRGRAARLAACRRAWLRGDATAGAGSATRSWPTCCSSAWR